MYLLPFTLVIIPLLSVLRPPSPFYATEQGQTKQERKKAASIMRATLSRRDQQRLNCIRDSRRTAHKFSSRRRAILLLNTFSRVPVIRRILNATSPSILLYFSPFQRFTALGVLLVSARATRVTLFIAPDSFLFPFSFPFFFFFFCTRDTDSSDEFT